MFLPSWILLIFSRCLNKLYKKFRFPGIEITVFTKFNPRRSCFCDHIKNLQLFFHKFNLFGRALLGGIARKRWKSIQSSSRFEGITNLNSINSIKSIKYWEKKQEQNLKTHFKINGSKLLTKKCFLFLFCSQAVYTTFKVWIFDDFSLKRQFLLKQYCFNTYKI